MEGHSSFQKDKQQEPSSNDGLCDIVVGRYFPDEFEGQFKSDIFFSAKKHESDSGYSSDSLANALGERLVEPFWARNSTDYLSAGSERIIDINSAHFSLSKIQVLQKDSALGIDLPKLSTLIKQSGLDLDNVLASGINENGYMVNHLYHNGERKCEQALQNLSVVIQEGSKLKFEFGENSESKPRIVCPHCSSNTHGETQGHRRDICYSQPPTRGTFRDGCQQCSNHCDVQETVREKLDNGPTHKSCNFPDLGCRTVKGVELGDLLTQKSDLNEFSKSKENQHKMYQEAGKKIRCALSVPSTSLGNISFEPEMTWHHQNTASPTAPQRLVQTHGCTSLRKDINCVETKDKLLLDWQLELEHIKPDAFNVLQSSDNTSIDEKKRMGEKVGHKASLNPRSVVERRRRERINQQLSRLRNVIPNTLSQGKDTAAMLEGAVDYIYLLERQVENLGRFYSH
eukprot:TRINITY_DN2597_c0_g1_i1.p1 TRINITY_DN2597_c0_g1~~TRINITY_DN2597_c0_g1_i1.p1  ORF type:complete len:456 (+),score=37.20 TRINITY_DN2597_c0_g1_i1:132-1499(+)